MSELDDILLNIAWFSGEKGLEPHAKEQVVTLITSLANES